MSAFKFKIFSDADGILFDFERHFLNLHGKPFDHFHYEWCWEQINSDPNFFYDLPLMDNVWDYWLAIAPYNPTILTGCPRAPGYDVAAAAKRRAISENFGYDVPVITCMSKDKALHMVQPGDILIDDHMKNIVSWRDAGGTGILFVNHEQAIRDFNLTVEALSEL